MVKKQTGEKLDKLVPTRELIIFLIGTFFLTTMQGMLGNYRQAYLVNVLGLESKQVGFINSFCTIAGFIINFFLMMIIDRPPKDGHNKFKPFVRVWAIPTAVLTVLLFWTPSFIPRTGVIIVAYLICIQVVYNIANTFAGTLNNIAVVISPNSGERDTALTWRGIVNAIGNSAPLVVVAVAGVITDDEGLQYLGSAIACAVVCTCVMLLACSMVKERVTYSVTRKNPLEGYLDILSNKYAWIVLLSEFLKNFRGIANYMGIFLAAALLGSTSKYILLGLPTGIGTFVGMLIVKALLNKFNSKQIYIASGVYSVLANTLAFTIGTIYFKTGSSALQIVFVLSLFLIGLQFGASNLLPAMFQADILEDIELKTRKRLDASLGFVCGIGSTISGAIATGVAPLILYGDSSIIQYIQPQEGVYPDQTLHTKIMLLFFYTIFHGLMMLLAGVPFFFYRLTGARKQKIHEAVLKNRAAELKAKGEQVPQNNAAFVSPPKDTE